MKGFTLIELLITLVIIGIVIAIGIPGYNAVRKESEIETMRTRAIQIQASKLALVEAIGPNQAAVVWTGTDESIYDNVLRALLPPEYPADLSILFPAPYSLDLGDNPTDSVILNDSTAGTISLQKY